MDSAADQSVVSQGFKIMFNTGQQIRRDGAFVGMEGSQYPIVCAAAMVEDQTSDQLVIIVVNQAAYNEDLKQHDTSSPENIGLDQGDKLAWRAMIINLPNWFNLHSTLLG